MKIKFFVTIVLVAAIAIGVGYAFTNKAAPTVQASILQVKRNTPTVLPTPLPGISEQVIQKYAYSKILTKSAKKVDISVANFRLENGQFVVDTCFQSPNNAEWRVWDASATAADQQLLLDTIAPLESVDTLNGKKRVITFSPAGKNMKVEEKVADGKPGYVCEALAFYLPSEGINLSQVTLTIKSIGALPREGQECDFYTTIVQSQLDARKTGITFDCSTSEGGARVNILKKPDTMSLEDAQKMVSSDEFFTLQGPWEFAGSVQ